MGTSKLSVHMLRYHFRGEWGPGTLISQDIARVSAVLSFDIIISFDRTKFIFFVYFFSHQNRRTFFLDRRSHIPAMYVTWVKSNLK